MKKIFILLSFYVLSACGISETMDAVKNTPKKMDGMQGAMNETVVGVKDQRKLIPLKELMSEENYDLLIPIPTKLMPYAKKFAEVVTADEVVELAYLWLKEIDEVNPRPALDKDGNEIPYTAAEIDHMNTVKLGRLMALQAICGFLPQATVEQVIALNIYSISRFESTAYELLMLRTQFVRDVLLNASLLSSPLKNVGELQQAIVYTKNLDFIARLPFSDRISVQTRGFKAPFENFGEKFEKGLALTMWKRIKVAADSDLKVEMQTVSSNPQEDQALFAMKQKVAAEARAEVDTFIQYWNQQK